MGWSLSQCKLLLKRKATKMDLPASTPKPHSVAELKSAALSCTHTCAHAQTKAQQTLAHAHAQIARAYSCCMLFRLWIPWFLIHALSTQTCMCIDVHVYAHQCTPATHRRIHAHKSVQSTDVRHLIAHISSASSQPILGQKLELIKKKKMGREKILNSRSCDQLRRKNKGN